MPKNTVDIDLISDKIVASYRKAFGDEIVEILLYGSYARGDYTGDSDIDFVAIVRGDRPLLQEALRKVWDDSADIGVEYDAVISPAVVPYDEFERYREVLPYYTNIEREGQRIG